MESTDIYVVGAPGGTADGDLFDSAETSGEISAETSIETTTDVSQFTCPAPKKLPPQLAYLVRNRALVIDFDRTNSSDVRVIASTLTGEERTRFLLASIAFITSNAATSANSVSGDQTRNRRS